MKSYSLIIGARNPRGRFSRRDEKLLQEITARHFPDGFTILEAKGGWYNPVKKIFQREESRQILVSPLRSTKLLAWCNELGRALKQKEIIVIESGTARRIRIKAGRP